MCVAEQKGRQKTNGYSVTGRAGLELYDDATVDEMVKKAVSGAESEGRGSRWVWGCPR